ncbi:MAG: isoleucine--tRNA ligase [Elusimicrobiota bacterium]
MIDYSKTVNLPRTKFPMKANLPVKEPEIISRWEKIDIYRRLIEKGAAARQFVLHDGPPYANGHIHIGHALNKILKDIIVKYKTMRGEHSPYVPGWDCHGLPIEYQLFKDLGVDKRQIDRIEFRKKAREFAKKFVDIQRGEFIRLGVFGDWENPYLTMSPQYESAIIGVFGRLVQGGFIYRAKKPIYWCPHCETALAEAEVEYADSISPSVYVKFEAVSFLNQPAFAVIWTTTPWTLPANVALAFHPDEEYVVVQGARGENLILAKKLLQKFSSVTGTETFKLLGTYTGKQFEGVQFRHPFSQRVSTGVLADFVSMEEGTGIVHIAPGHGVEDYRVGLKYKLPVLSPVDYRGVFTDDVPAFKGHRVFAANPLITESLRDKGLLVAEGKLTHSYPHCWRCKHAIIFRATDQWFLNIEHENLRQRMLDAIKKVRWLPAGGINRISGMIENRPDWCLSRQRYWGVPIPALYCAKCERTLLSPKVIEKFERIAAEEGSDAWFTRPVEEWTQGISPALRCECGGSEFKKEEDILDVWFDSGVSYEAVLGGPGLFGGAGRGSGPVADMYLEGSDQHRGWFQTSLIPSVALYNQSPYRTVLTHGFTVDGDGKKMSKSLGNVIAPQEIINKFGSEILRLWVASSDYREDVRISKEIIERLVETYRKIRNTLRFILGNISDFNYRQHCVDGKNMPEIDRYMMHRLQGLKKDVLKHYDEYEFHMVISEINRFCVTDLSNFYLDILKDRLYTFAADSAGRRSAQTVMRNIFSTLVHLMAPVLSFTAEEAWQTMLTETSQGGPDDSVFLGDMPEINEGFVSPGLEETWGRLITLRDRVNLKLEEARKSNVIGASLEAKVVLHPSGGDAGEFLKRYVADLPSIFIVSQVEITDGGDVGSKPAPDEVDAEVVVRKADGKKCPRCWNWSVGPQTEGLCPRCKDAIKS